MTTHKQIKEALSRLYLAVRVFLTVKAPAAEIDKLRAAIDALEWASGATVPAFQELLDTLGQDPVLVVIDDKVQLGSINKGEK